MRSLFRLFLLSLSLLTTLFSGQAKEFEQYFSDSTLRVDYILSGNVKSQSISLDGMSRMPGWYGKKQNLTSFPVHGDGTIVMRLAATGELIYVYSDNVIYANYADLSNNEYHVENIV